jgi:threonine/homoserine/homoserine lactone efflux protein
MKLAKLFFAGLLISLIGSLPFGTLNVATFKIAISSGKITALWFAIGCVVIEVIYVRISLSAMSWVTKNEKTLKVMSFIVLFITIALALSSFIAAFNDGSDYSKQFQLKSSLSAFILGIALSAINPAQIPFWFGFSAVLQSKKILFPVRLHYGIYMVAIAIGSMLASFIFINGGHFMIKGIGNNRFMINIIVGSCFIIAALVQLFRILYKKKVETNKT